MTHSNNNSSSKEQRPKIMRTVWPDQTLTQPEWLKHVKAGLLVKDMEPVHRANTMMAQYRAEEGWLDKLVKMIHG